MMRRKISRSDGHAKAARRVEISRERVGASEFDLRFRGNTARD